ncbi:MAG: hypothetical protein HYX73_10310 [Acidobacteria bacterium]|nr:hypothetical protein [Acidobacteriota bacterium]
MTPMIGSNGTEEPKWKRFLTPWKITAVLIAAFLISQAFISWRDSFIVSTLDNSPAFAVPEFTLEFSRKIQYDPLTFVGRGARAGFWTWTPEGLELTSEGIKYFRLEGGMIVSQVQAGRRKVSRIRNKEMRDGIALRYTIDFLYEWTEISPPAVALLYPPPKMKDEYLGKAILYQGPNGWEVTSLETRDFDEPLEHLQSIASGVLQ